MASFKLKGLKRYKNASDKKKRQAMRGLAKGLFQEAEGIMTISKQAYVPVDTGALRNSGFVDTPKRTRRTVSIQLGYGGTAAPYAIFVHENLEAFHPVGQAKYLEIPLMSARQGMAKRLARDVKREMKR